jgi:hypothetical protein
MVYIKLAENLYQKIKEYINREQLQICGKDMYIAYPEFSKNRFM